MGKLLCITIGAILMVHNVGNSMGKATPEDLEAERTVSTGMNQFGVDFYKTVACENEGNLISSPISANLVLSMAADGARENTETQMRQTLRLPEDRSVGKRGVQSIIDRLNSVKKVQLSVANKIYTATGFEVKPEFKETTETYFRSSTESVDFNNPAQASQTINTWCAEQTNNRITEIITADDVDGAAMVLVNAVYFKGNWVNKFDEQLTRPKPFYVDETTSKDVPMMFKKSRFNTGEIPALNARYIEIPYEHENEDDALSMFILLPNEKTGLKTAQDNMGSVDFKKLHDDNLKQEAFLYLPKFKAESTLELQPVLEKMGMVDMFQDRANFSGITDSPPLKISKVIQKAFIEVNEQGSEAAAVTAVGVSATSAIIGAPQPLVFTIDRPFLYSIHHSKTNTVLFQGHIRLPETE